MELLHPDPEILLRKAGFDERDAVKLLPLMHRLGPEEGFRVIAAASCYGVGPDRIDEFVRRNPRLPLAATLSAIEELERGRWEFELSVPPALKGHSIRDERSPNERVLLFPCTFRAFPERLNDRISEADRGIFAMFLPGRERRRLYSQLNDAERDHAFDAFGYLRFWRDNDRFIVSEIQSDLYGRVRERSSRELYKHWAKLLLLVFEMYVVQQCSEPRLDEVITKGGVLQPQVILPSSAGIRRMWPDRVVEQRDHADFIRRNLFEEEFIRKGIARELAERLYDRLPRGLGYVLAPLGLWLEDDPPRPATDLREAWIKDLPLHPEADWGLEEVLGEAEKHLPQLENNARQPYQSVIEVLRAAGRKPAEPKIFAPFHEELGKWLVHSGTSRRQWSDLHQEFFPAAILTDVATVGFPERFPLRPAATIAGAENVPALRVPPESIIGMTMELFRHYRQLVSTLPAQARPFLLQDFTLLSKGIEGGASAAWWSTSRRARPELLHIERQDRHPQIRLGGTDGASMVALGVKGGGMRKTEGSPIFNHLDIRELRAPIYKLAGESYEEELIPSHRFWGGLTLAHAKAEFIRTLAVSHLMQAVAPSDGPHVPIPLDIQIPTALPTWYEGRTSWLSFHEYSALVLDEHQPNYSDRLVTLKSASPCDVRLAQIINRVFERSEEAKQSLVATEREIRDSLHFLYWLHGFKLHWPGGGIVPSGTSVGCREILHFLRTVYEHNTEAAEAIYSRVERRSLQVMAAVHGTGGHLGGSRHSRLGAISGGAVAVRNIDGAGSVHDLDADVYLPWIRDENSDLVSQADQTAAIRGSQMSDLLYWRDAMYWLSLTIRGALLEQQVSISEHRLGLFDRFKRVGELEPELQSSLVSFEQNLLRVLGSDARRAMYTDISKRGKNYRDERRRD